MKKVLIALAVLALIPMAAAQTEPTMSFTAATTTGNGSVIPVLTWSTAPAAASCTASGDVAWNGTKAASGTVTLPATQKSVSYNLTCTWTGSGQKKTVRWVPPTKNTDGSTLTDLKGYKIFYSTNQANVGVVSGNSPYILNEPATTNVSLGPFTPGTWYLGMKAVNTAGVESDMSQIISFVSSATSATRTVGITVNPVPNAPTNLTIE